MSLAMTFCPDGPRGVATHRCMRTDAHAAREQGQRGSSVGFTDAGASLTFSREQDHGPLPQMRRSSDSPAIRRAKEMPSVRISATAGTSGPKWPAGCEIG